MQTRIDPAFLETAAGREADSILRTCVHCGFCTATCPTYQLLGDELDGPRGRIYLIKQLLEGNTVTAKTQAHLDRCLTCRSCETTCPSGVRYGRLVDIGRELIEDKVARPWWQDLTRSLLRHTLPHPARVAALLKLGRLFKPLLPDTLAAKLPTPQLAGKRPKPRHARKMLLLEGCVQSVATPATNNATANVLDKLGISLISPSGAGCCGAVSQHLAASHQARAFMRRNIDAWRPHIQDGVEAIVITASGCGTMVKEYGHLLADDPLYADMAAQVSALAKDIGEILRDEELPVDRMRIKHQRIAYHSPCSLQHAQQLDGMIESILTRAGFTLTPVDDAHLCCGSAGTYSILQPTLSQQLLENKLECLEEGSPELIVTANVGCQMHLASQAGRPVNHWIEILDESLF